MTKKEILEQSVWPLGLWGVLTWGRGADICGAAVITVSVMFRVNSHRQNLALRNRFWCPDADSKQEASRWGTQRSPFAGAEGAGKGQPRMGSSLNTQKRQKKEVEQSRRQDVQEQATEVCVLMNVMQVWRSITAELRTGSKQKRTKEQAPSCRTEEEVWQKDARQTPPGREQDGLWSVSLKVWLWTKTKVRKPLSCTILLDTFQIQDFNKVLWCSGSWVLMFFSSAGLSWCWGGDCTVKHFLSQTFTPEILLDRDSLQVLHQEQWLFFWTGFRGRIQFVFFGTFSFWPVWITASFLVLWCCCSSLTAAAAGGGGVGVGGSICFNPNSNPSIKHQILVWIWTIFFQISSN